MEQETNICKALRLCRQYADITQRQFADLAGCSVSQITRIETGRLDEIKNNRYILSVCNVILQLTGIEIDTSPYLQQTAQRNSKTGVRGVCFSLERQKYIATLRIQRQHFFLGYFNTLEDAATTRQQAEKAATEGVDALRSWLTQFKSDRALSMASPEHSSYFSSRSSSSQSGR